ncbi:dihydroorotate dehydrogenase electron transfer subunit [Chlorobium phaeovibrioides]|uniref:Dihydroorotate dehydrogenase electron transfer subunit n=1 Tax=Chlorobium phaeovibrioides TaxID=1094 RepID=A0A432AUC4_CHLPH|nr:dihydroorotate dehydrogenase electron transfer subunit [Chlorobium phaeovibrioides]RTY37877.1 dihydroorotate dehydrogenase electron transfer subunit [Chlorobium phaeovibrioides]
MHETCTIADSRATITASRRISPDTSVITLACPEIAGAARPGNFVNVRVSSSTQPLLRRPFSIHNAENGQIELMVKEIGCGTELFCRTEPGTELMVLGPLGNSFSEPSGTFSTAVLVSGGIGTAPMRFLEKAMTAAGKKSINLIGGRSQKELLSDNLSNCRFSTDDGSCGVKGTVVDLLDAEISAIAAEGRVKIFGCGPTPMLKALASYCRQHSLACEVSLESVMGCGFGICYGCSVEIANPEGGTRTILLCREGPVIDGALMV